MAGEEGGVAAIIKQEGDRVRLSVPMVGFPPGFKLRPGERVVLVNEASGPAVRPLVQASVVNMAAEEIVKGGRCDIEGQPHVLQAATVLGEPSPRGERGEPGHRSFGLWILDRPKVPNRLLPPVDCVSGKGIL